MRAVFPFSVISSSGPASETSVDARQARYVVGVLSLLLDVVGKDSLLGMILQQARNEVVSVADADAAEQNASRAA
jgi:hypothetical protein